MRALKAFLTDTMGVRSIVCAETASKARYKMYLAAKDVGYKPQFKNIHVKRVKEFDDIRTEKCVSIEHAKGLLDDIKKLGI